MSIEDAIQSTDEVATNRGIKVLVHGPSGSGKTYLASTTTDLDRTLIISAEQGLLSLHEYSIDSLEVTSLQEFRAAKNFAQRQNRYTWIVLDSISEIAEVILGSEKEQTRDPRKAYGEMADEVFSILREMRYLDCNVVFTAKQEAVEQNGVTIHRPLLPGQQLTSNISYMLDEVLALHVDRENDGQIKRYLQTQRTPEVEAKDRSGALDMYEPADLSTIYEKITGEVGGEATGANGLPPEAPDHGAFFPGDAKPLSDYQPSKGEVWQKTNRQFHAALGEAGLADEVEGRFRDAIRVRHGLDPSDEQSWQRIPAACLGRWRDVLNKRDTTPGDNGERPERADFVDSFVRAHADALPDETRDAAAE